MALIPPNPDITFLEGVKKVVIAKTYPEMNAVTFNNAVRGKVVSGVNAITHAGTVHTIVGGMPLQLPTAEAATGVMFDRLAFQIVFQQKFYVECSMFNAGYAFGSSSNTFDCWQRFETNYENPSKPKMPSPPWTWGQMAVYNQLLDPEWGPCFNYVFSSPGTGGLILPSNYNGIFSFVEDYVDISVG